MARQFDLSRARAHRRPSLTPMVDVVFLLLVFFMLAARFGLDRVIPLSPPGETRGAYEGAPRLVTVKPGAVLLNGQPLPAEALAPALRRLMPGPEAAVVLQTRDGADLQRLVSVLDRLSGAGLANLVLVE